SVLLLQLREQAHVLDGDDGLIRESLQKVDLILGEGPRSSSGYADHPHRSPVAKHRHRQTASPEIRAREVATVLRGFYDNCNLHDGAIQHRATRRLATVRPHGVQRPS